ncbi:hypothetical protein BHE74_00053704 [Ensete ventricosum]|nr:hypothetical protein BHE74_00053704 [Ensete ventricosum]
MTSLRRGLAHQMVPPPLVENTPLHARLVHCHAPHERLQQFASEFTLVAHLRLLGARVRLTPSCSIHHDVSPWRVSKSMTMSLEELYQVQQGQSDKSEDKAEGGTSVESSIPYSHGGRALVIKGAKEVENAKAEVKELHKTSVDGLLIKIAESKGLWVYAGVLDQGTK